MPEETKTCSECLEVIKAGATKCRFCGSPQLKEVRARYQTGNPAVQSQMDKSREKWRTEIKNRLDDLSYLPVWLRRSLVVLSFTQKRPYIEDGLCGAGAIVFGLISWTIGKPLVFAKLPEESFSHLPTILSLGLTAAIVYYSFKAIKWIYGEAEIIFEQHLLAEREEYIELGKKALLAKSKAEALQEEKERQEFKEQFLKDNPLPTDP